MDQLIRQEKQREHEFQSRERKQSEQQRDRLEQLRDDQKREMKSRRDTMERLENKKRLFERQSDLKKESFLNDNHSDRSIFTKKMQWQKKNIELEKRKLMQDRRVIYKNEKAIDMNVARKLVNANVSDKKYSLLLKQDTKVGKDETK